jgi:multidrug efflux pump subunit AcrB
VKQLQTNPVEFPIEIMVSSLAEVGSERSAADLRTLREIGTKVEDLLRSVPGASHVRTDWQPESVGIKLQIGEDRANFAGITNADVASSVGEALNGKTVTTLREGDVQIPVVARLRPEERARLSDLQNL